MQPPALLVRRTGLLIEKGDFPPAMCLVPYERAFVGLRRKPSLLLVSSNDEQPHNAKQRRPAIHVHHGLSTVHTVPIHLRLPDKGSWYTKFTNKAACQSH